MDRKGSPLARVSAAILVLLSVAVASWDSTPDSAAAQTSACTNGVAVPDPTNNPGLVSDCEALLVARDTLAGSATPDWSDDTPITDWNGITVSGVPQRVTELDLSWRDLKGSISAALGSLSSLVHLNLEFNELSGTIPKELGNLLNLEVLNLKRNELSGTIPAQLGDLSNLEVLILGRNDLTRPIPSELSGLDKLQELDLSRNQLAGPIPEWLPSLSGLKVLHLEGSHLTGPIPPEMSNLSKLEFLDLSSNPLAVSIPAWMDSLTSLELLKLDHTQLIGDIPSELSRLSRLRWFGLSDNQLTGHIPAGLGSLSNLVILDFAGNQLTGHIPAELGSLSNLAILDLAENQLTGAIPPSLGNLSRLRVLHLSGNNLSGCIPEELPVGASNDLYLLGLPSCTALLITGPFISSVTPGLGSLTISWRGPRRTEGPPVISYDLRYIETLADESLESNWTLLEDVWRTGSGALTYELGNLTNEIQYDLQLRGANAVGPGPWSAVVSGTPTAEDLPPRSPANVWYYRDGSTIMVSWDASQGATHYKVYHDSSIDLNCGSGSSLGTSSCEELAGNVAGTTYTHASPNQAENYYWISACNSAGCSEINLFNYALFVASAPAAPAIVSVTGEVGSLTVAWNAPTQADGSAVFSYDLRYIETSTDGTLESNWTVVEDVWTTGSGALIYDLAGLADKTQYNVQLRAVNPVGEGHWSETFTEVAGIPATVLAVRSFSQSRVQPGGEVVVTVTSTGLGILAFISERMPDGFSYVSSNLESDFVRVSGAGIYATLIGRSIFEYTVTASAEEGSYSFSGSALDFDRVRRPITGASGITVQAAPSVELSYSSGSEALLLRPYSPISVTVTFSEPVYAFNINDINATNGSVSNLVGSEGDAVFVFDVTPDALGEVTVDINAGVAEDADGNGNTASDQLSLGIPYDDDRDGAISRGEVITAITDYLFEGTITREQAIAVIELYLFSSG